MIAKTPVAYFASLKSRKAQNRSISSILVEIQNGTHAKRIAAMRQAQGENRDNLKRQLPCFMASGTSTAGHKAADFRDHSGLLQVDVDDVGEERAAELRDELGHDPHIFAAFISPSGSGVKALIRIPADKDKHPASFSAVSEYLRSKYAVEVDGKCKDISRVCFVSDDPELVLNADAVELEVDGSPLPDCEKKGEREGLCASPPPNSSKSYKLQATGYKLRTTLYTLQQGAKMSDFFGLEIHFQRNVTRFFAKPSRGHRNQAIVQIAAKLFYVVKPDFVFLMLQEFKRQHQDAYADYDGDFDGEASAMIEGLLDRYPSELNEAERSHYLDLPLDRQTAFRICRSLAHCESDADAPLGLFFLSREALAHRLGHYGSENAKWIFNELVKRGVIEMVKKGTARRTGHRGEATMWRWLLGLNGS
jgi:hypothetical protein